MKISYYIKYMLLWIFKKLPLSAMYRHKIATLIKRAIRWRHEKSKLTQLNTIIKPVISDRKDIIFFGVIDWHFRYQRPQQLATNMAVTGERVFYISPHFIDTKETGYEIELLNSNLSLYQVKLYVNGAPPVYFRAGEDNVERQIRAGLAKLICELNIWASISVVQHAFWTHHAFNLPNNTVIYDCMDHHDGFGKVHISLSSLENILLSNADTVTVTSDWLFNYAAEKTSKASIVRNGCDYYHFSNIPKEIFRDEHGRKIIGYFGAIAEWFDIQLIEDIAKKLPECLIVLVGNDTVNACKKLSQYKNINFVGEQPYNKLPFYLHGFDVCLLPFSVTSLTLATNPVKVYEYLCAGKHVVCVDLPEIQQFNDLVYKTSSRTEFVDKVITSAETPPTMQQIKERQHFSSLQTWEVRAHEMLNICKNCQLPLVSIIVLTYNNLPFTKICIESLYDYTDYPNWELIVVDNASTDGSPLYLKEMSKKKSNLHLVINDTNNGFAAGNNQGMVLARGEYFVLLNNDTVVTPGWVNTMLRHFVSNKKIGLLGPITNNIGNEAKVDFIQYSDLNEMPTAARTYTLKNMGQLYSMRTVAFFCVMMPKFVFDKIGGLDENFGRGYFEDDDYCRRVEQIGLEISCAEDVFVHHHLSASFSKLPDVEKIKLFEDNKRYYESKWGNWISHQYRN